MNIKHPFVRCWLAGLAAMTFLLPLGASAEILNLSQEPLFAGTSAEPNVLVAVDDSGSMDLETLFPTDEGWLYWNNGTQSGADATGTFYNSGSTYGYLFPFDQIQTQSLTIPPIPELAYARSASYNKAYFNPATEYDPWHTYEPSPADNAPYDPEDDNGSIDLTQQQVGDFAFQSGMFIPGSDNQGYTYICINRRFNLSKPATDQEVQQGSCEPLFILRFELVRESTGGTPAETVSNAGNRELPYFPATFYVAPGSELGSEYDSYKTERTLVGQAPDGGSDLVGYEIKLDNFNDTGDYEEAIQNFANWFTYYRKRHLATRGGIVAAFERISDIRVAACTINNRRDLSTGNGDLQINRLNETAQRASFYSSIFNIDYSVNRGTPNREALNYLGRQYETNTSLISAPCQRNFSILFTDGYSNPSTNSNVGKADEPYGAPFSDGKADTIADIAMKYYKNLETAQTGDLKVPDECRQPNPPARLNCETDFHMVTFGVTLNQTGTIFNNRPAFDAENNDPYTNFPNWPDPNTGGRSKKQIDDLWHATINSRGELLNAETPAEIADKFTTALQRILGEEGSASSVSLSSSNLTADSVAYQASFTSGIWSGELKALPQNSDGSFDDALWSASKTLTDSNDPDFTAPNDRVILTQARTNCGNNNNGSVVPLRFDRIKNGCGELTEAEVDYIRGERTNERGRGGQLRDRNDNILGDIVHSSPLYIAAPNRIRYPNDWDDLLTQANERTAEDRVGPYAAGQNSFAQGPAKNRTPMVYVGANDGMLHGFEAESGKEKFAYVPGAVLPNLSYFTKPAYRHRYYVDGTPVSGDVIVGNSWRTVLVGGLGGGGRSIYALDVTDPSAFSESNTNTVLWEFEHPELGYTYGQPSIVRLHDGRWAAVFGNGYNSDRGSAQLFIVDIADGSLIRRIDTLARPDQAPNPCEDALNIGLGDLGIGVGQCSDDDEDDDSLDLVKVTVCHNNNKTQEYSGSALLAHLGHGDTIGACGTTVTDDPINGLGEVFPVDLDGDFITDYIYAGDLYGNVWKFDLTSTSNANWGIGLNGKPLFKATDADGNPQPITTQPQVGIHPYGSRYGVMVYFGTGKYLEIDDRAAKTDETSSFYGIWDLDVFTFNNANGGDGTFNTNLTSEIPRSRLQQQEIIETPQRNGDTYRLVTDYEVNYQARDDGRGEEGKRGWYIDLDYPGQQGEMVVTDSRIEGNTIAFSTTIPNTETCTASGSGYFMLLDRRTGGRTDYPAFDLNDDKQIVKRDDTFVRDGAQVGASGLLISQGIPGQGSHQTDAANDTAYYIVPASDGTTRQVFTQREPDRRRSWREIRR
jgi:type IV pilus assembly protein PilY1